MDVSPAHALICHSRKSTCVTNLINNGSVLLKRCCKSYQGDSMSVTSTLKLRQLIGIQTSFDNTCVFLWIGVTVRHGFYWLSEHMGWVKTNKITVYQIWNVNTP